MLLNDKVFFRMQWPQYADLQVNGVLVRAINRPGAQLVGLNGRDDGPIITPWTKDGLNKIFLAGCDARIFCVGVRIVKRRSVQQILNLILNESVGEPFEDALARVRRCVNGGVSNDAESDGDVEVVAGSFGVNLRCPLSNISNYGIVIVRIDAPIYFANISYILLKDRLQRYELSVDKSARWDQKLKASIL